MPHCSGNLDDHCCYVNGQVCDFLEENTLPNRRWVCGLYRELGSWPAVYEDPRYQEHLSPFWAKFKPGVDCGSWPPPGEKCDVCGVIGG